MKIIPPKPFTIEKGNRAVLLLHGFTGNTNDVKRLGRFLSERNYTVHAPLYKGHGGDPKDLIETDPIEWWNSVLEGYDYLRNKGFDEIAVAGVSLGGIFSLRLGEERPTKAIVAMSAPALAKNTDSLQERIIDYTIKYKKLSGTFNEQEDQPQEIAKKYVMPKLSYLQGIINDTSAKLQTIQTPVHILRGLRDDEYYCESADLIYNSVKSRIKSVKSFINSGHILTLDQEKELVFEEIYHFFEGLKWKE
ncbi:alpha/beta hydrolase [Lysinibacillus endophyticus]|uniref:Alpha/beta fold hydrolase n=1 Tax=Ureibacillus endophyticus TaxID=1978490 RepID=A0A494YYQ3_9BACL|nr:alpha/beta fold hydrolase [Lysinibacillus endophyticus]MCP1146184.1 alpha/beta hydrolase [Lysinibacillus endophyticus]RKQ15132.1 alpha/beta fold hydrolase [Lysinibacillus endophyticus]